MPTDMPPRDTKRWEGDGNEVRARKKARAEGLVWEKRRQRLGGLQDREGLWPKVCQGWQQTSVSSVSAYQGHVQGGSR